MPVPIAIQSGLIDSIAASRSTSAPSSTFAGRRSCDSLESDS